MTHLRRVNAEVLKRIKSDEDVADVSVNLQLIISPLEVADYCLLRGRRERRGINNTGAIDTPERKTGWVSPRPRTPGLLDHHQDSSLL